MRTAVKRDTRKRHVPAVTSTGKPRNDGFSKSGVMPYSFDKFILIMTKRKRHTEGAVRSGASMCAFQAAAVGTVGDGEGWESQGQAEDSPLLRVRRWIGRWSRKDVNTNGARLRPSKVTDSKLLIL